MPDTSPSVSLTAGSPLHWTHSAGQKQTASPARTKQCSVMDSPSSSSSSSSPSTSSLRITTDTAVAA